MKHREQKGNKVIFAKLVFLFDLYFSHDLSVHFNVSKMILQFPLVKMVRYWKCNIFLTRWTPCPGKSPRFSYFMENISYNKNRQYASRLQDRCFPVNIAKFLSTTILKNICKRLLLEAGLILLAKFTTRKQNNFQNNFYQP